MCDGPHDFIPADGVARVTTHFSYYGRPVTHKFHFQHEGHWSSDELESLAGTVQDEWRIIMAPFFVDPLNYIYTRAADISRHNGPVAVLNNDDSGALDLTGLWIGSAVVVELGTDTPGRSYRGRMYLVGVPQPYVYGDFLLPFHASDYAGAVQGWLGLSGSFEGAQPVVVSYCSDGAWRSDAAVTPITRYSCDGVMDSQRRRAVPV